MLEPLEQIFFSQPHRVCQKWRHYFWIYERHFRQFRDRPMRFLEIGLSQGGSLDMWARYFGRSAELIGIDSDASCKRFEAAGIKIFIGDQSDRAFLARVASEVGELDVVLDDGGHRMDQQINTFEALYPALREGGVYMCEDVHTSYFPAFGGSFRQSGTFIEHMKGKIDELHFWYLPDRSPTPITQNTAVISFYDSIVAVEKVRRQAPLYVEVGS